MKATVLLLLSFLLTTALLAPSIIILIGDNDTAWVMDFNEEEKKEEKKEISEKDFLFSLDFMLLSSRLAKKSMVSNFYLEGDYSYATDIFLPPPERSV